MPTNCANHTKIQILRTSTLNGLAGVVKRKSNIKSNPALRKGDFAPLKPAQIRF
jgi:hypothetical protein